jgi:hypothetical protein
MSIDLSAYKSIGSTLAVKLAITKYRVNKDDSFTSNTLRFTDSLYPLTIDGNTYLGLGNFLSITSTSNELRSSTAPITVTISGIPTSSINEVVNSRIKGSKIDIYRVLYNPENNQVLNITGNPAGRFFGYVTNYTISEDFNAQTRTATNTVELICSSVQEVLENKIAGRKCSPNSMKAFYPTDISMDRVPNLAGANFDFGNRL